MSTRRERPRSVVPNPSMGYCREAPAWPTTGLSEDRGLLGHDVRSRSDRSEGSLGDEARYGSRMLAFLFTDVEGSTRTWERAPDAMRIAREGVMPRRLEASVAKAVVL